MVFIFSYFHSLLKSTTKELFQWLSTTSLWTINALQAFIKKLHQKIKFINIKRLKVVISEKIIIFSLLFGIQKKRNKKFILKSDPYPTKQRADLGTQKVLLITLNFPSHKALSVCPTLYPCYNQCASFLLTFYI